MFFAVGTLYRVWDKETSRIGRFALLLDVRSFLKKLRPPLVNSPDIKQLSRSSGSIGANYLEADNPLSRKDALMRIRICLKESRESAYWLALLDVEPSFVPQRDRLLDESTQLARIFATIASKLIRSDE